MGFGVTTTRALDLQVSRTNDATACVVPAGARINIVATDDIEWLYIAPFERNWDYDFPGGWFHVLDHGYTALVNGEYIETMALFPGLLYAD